MTEAIDLILAIAPFVVDQLHRRRQAKIRRNWDIALTALGVSVASFKEYLKRLEQEERARGR